MTLSFIELCDKMKRDKWIRKDFKDSKHYIGWYHRNKRKVEVSGKWHIDNPNTFWYRPLEF